MIMAFMRMIGDTTGMIMRIDRTILIYMTRFGVCRVGGTYDLTF